MYKGLPPTINLPIINIGSFVLPASIAAPAPNIYAPSMIVRLRLYLSLNHPDAKLESEADMRIWIESILMKKM
jgi:hypothetical protein